MTPADKLEATLKRHNPSRVVVYTSDDDGTQISIPGGRNRRWKHVTATIETRFKSTWSRVEMLDKGGALLGTCENTAPADDLEDLVASGKSVPAQVERLLAIVLKAQRDALAMRNDENQAMLRAFPEVVRELTTSVKSLSAVHQAQRDAERELAKLQLEAAATPEPDQLQQILEAVPVIAQAMPFLKQLITGSSPVSTPTPKNGVAK
jgi:hypothetical protein